MFFSKKAMTQLNSEEYEKLSKRITQIEADVDRTLNKLLTLRGLVHRKFPGGALPEKTESVKNTDGLDELRK